MPGFDGTGPAGMGPMTGRGLGYCAPSQRNYIPRFTGSSVYPAPLYGPGFGRMFGFGRGFGLGRGRGNRRGFIPGFIRGRGYGYSRGYGRPFGY